MKLLESFAKEALRKMLRNTSNADDAGVREINVFARQQGIGGDTLRALIAETAEEKEQIRRGQIYQMKLQNGGN